MIAIIDYKAGNVGSVRNALFRLGVDNVLTSDPVVIERADGVILPGQGRAGQAMGELEKTGIAELIPRLEQPFLGICLGMQVLSEASEEDDVRCLGVIPGICRRFPPSLKVPQLGWNRLELRRGSYLTAGIDDGAYFYFVNSYYFDAKTSVAGTTAYGFNFPSFVQKDNFSAVQFHPEKSGLQGMRMLRNFCEACPC